MRNLRALAAIAAMSLSLSAWANMAPDPRPRPLPPTQPSSQPTKEAPVKSVGFLGAGAAMIALAGGLMLVRRGRGR